MANRQDPNDPSSLSLSPSGTSGKPDFSNVRSQSDTVRNTSGGGGGTGSRPDFSNVQSHSDTVPNTGGGGGAGAQSYTVQKGDTLSEIAQRHYGKASKWNAIFEANRDQLDDPDLIKPGQVLRLPA